MIRFILNDKKVETDLPPGITLLDFIRYQRQLTGTKIGCREGDCGACTVLAGSIKNETLEYESVTSCLVPLANIAGKHIVTIEGINFEGSLNPIQEAMAAAGATQCGFCTPGFVMSLAGFCLTRKGREYKDAIAAIDGNICRCTGYKSIERAAEKIAKIASENNNEDPITFVTEKKILPAYFSAIPGILNELNKSSGSELPTTDSRLILAGGTDLYVQKPEELVHSDSRYVFNDPAFKGISKENNRCVIGASVTASELLYSPVFTEAFPRFHRYAKLVSSTPIRNIATVAGNFINASPIGDLSIFFLALDARLDLAGGTERTIPLRKLYKGYKQLNKSPEEYIRRIWFEWPSASTHFHFEKVSKRTHLDIASVNSAICLHMDGERIREAGLSAGGVAPVPLFLEKTSAFLTGKEINADLLKELEERVQEEIAPISDARGSKEYKRLLLGQLIKAHFLELFPEMAEELIH